MALVQGVSCLLLNDHWDSFQHPPWPRRISNLVYVWVCVCVCVNSGPETVQTLQYSFFICHNFYFFFFVCFLIYFSKWNENNPKFWMWSFAFASWKGSSDWWMCCRWFYIEPVWKGLYLASKTVPLLLQAKEPLFGNIENPFC